MAKQQSNSVPTSTPSKASAAAKPQNSIREVKPTVDDIRRRAYELYCQRVAKGTRGTPEGDWQQAERELTSK